MNMASILFVMRYTIKFVITSYSIHYTKLYDLKQCMDPEVPLNIVEMGLIYGIDVNDNNDVNIKMTMTTQGCPLHETLVQDATRYVKKVPGVNNVKVRITSYNVCYTKLLRNHYSCSNKL